MEEQKNKTVSYQGCIASNTKRTYTGTVIEAGLKLAETREIHLAALNKNSAERFVKQLTTMFDVTVKLEKVGNDLYKIILI